MDKKKIRAAKSSKKIGSKEKSSRVNDVHLLLSNDTKAFIKDLKVVMSPRLRSIIRHNLCGLSDDVQQFVCDNILMYLRTGHMIRFGEPQIDQIQGLILIEVMNSEANINFPPF